MIGWFFNKKTEPNSILLYSIMGWYGKLKTAKKVIDTVPDLSSPWNWILGIVNIILPGIITMDL